MSGNLPAHNELNHSCSPGACGNCGNPAGSFEPVTVPADGSEYLITGSGVIKITGSVPALV